MRWLCGIYRDAIKGVVSGIAALTRGCTDFWGPHETPDTRTDSAFRPQTALSDFVHVDARPVCARYADARPIAVHRRNSAGAGRVAVSRLAAQTRCQPQC